MYNGGAELAEKPKKVRFFGKFLSEDVGFICKCRIIFVPLQLFNPLTIRKMKKYLFILLILLGIVITETGCNSNTPDGQKPGGANAGTNQPANPATWSPVGKTYICDRSGADNNPNGLDFFLEVLRFAENSNIQHFCSASEDLTPLEPLSENYEEGLYKCSYPDVQLIFGGEKRPLQFVDTLTLHSDYWEQTFVLR